MSFLSFNAHYEKKSFKKVGGLGIWHAFCIYIDPFARNMASTTTALVRDNFDSISEVSWLQDGAIKQH